MALESVDWQRSSAVLAADWIEVKALSESTGAASKADLLKMQGLGSDEIDEHGSDRMLGDDSSEVDTEILNPRLEAWLDEVLVELDFRSRSLGDSYPFELDFNDDQWSVRCSEGAGNAEDLARGTYLACLMVTAVRFHLVRSPDDAKDQAFASGIDNCLQILAYLAAGQIVGGEAYWFGWPRIDNSVSMAAAVDSLFEQMGIHGERGETPKWATGSEKDGGVDVVAWRNFGDSLPGRVVLLGQVASGKTNWKAKSVIDVVRAHFTEWLRPYEQHSYLPAHFIAWPQYMEEPVPRAEYVHRLHLLEKMLGLVIDRLRLTELMAEVGRAGGLPPEHAEHFQVVLDWHDRMLATAKAA
jgi:hypothetical protein